MGIGGSIALVVIGAILAFAVKTDDLGGFLDINVVGWVLILAGLVGLVLTLWFWQSRRRRVVAVTPPAVDGGGIVAPDRRVVEENYRQTERNY